LRIEPTVHAALRGAAERVGLSLNEYCARRLAMPASDPGSPAARAVARAWEVVGDGLAGVAVFGSWARGDATRESDVDLLVVVDDSVQVARSLYTKWDQQPCDWEGHRVEALFTKLPREVSGAAGIWSEVAVDGIVLFDRDLALSLLLVDVRGLIAAGHLVRRRVHGQTYWVEMAA
jgi:predicted nucleotidyltransferase